MHEKFLVQDDVLCDIQRSICSSCCDISNLSTFEDSLEGLD